jgi:transcriptional regulator with XRE-family HTH domain
MAEPAAALDADPTLGDLLRYWRRVRSMSQLDLASAAMTTPRHMSFVETGRSRPSREMVLRLAGALDVPLRDRNGLLLAAGYAPLYVERALDDPALDRVNAAISGCLPSTSRCRPWSWTVAGTCCASTPGHAGCSPASSHPRRCPAPPTFSA